MPNSKDFDLTTKEGRQAYREALVEENPEIGPGGRIYLPLETSPPQRITVPIDPLIRIKELVIRVKELEDAIRLHRTKVQLIQREDMELWAHLNDGEQ